MDSDQGYVWTYDDVIDNEPHQQRGKAVDECYPEHSYDMGGHCNWCGVSALDEVPEHTAQEHLSCGPECADSN